MRNVAVTEGDKVSAQMQFGVTVNGFGVGDLSDAVRAVADAKVDELVAVYEATYDLAPSLRAGGADREALREAARIEVALREFMTDGGFGAITDTFENLDGLKQLPGIAAQRLMADGYGFGAEGDWKTAVMVRLVKVMARGLAGRNLVHGGLHLPSRPGRTDRCWAPTCSRSALRSRTRRSRARSIRCRSVAGATRSGWFSMRAPARPSSPP